MTTHKEATTAAMKKSTIASKKIRNNTLGIKDYQKEYIARKETAAAIEKATAASNRKNRIAIEITVYCEQPDTYQEVRRSMHTCCQQDEHYCYWF